MIQSLHISNYALISSIDITFEGGLNIITGETGAGKSIILGALSLLLGNRADTKVVRQPDMKSVIEATFTLDSDSDRLKEIFLQNSLDWDEKLCTLRREITPTGRSRAFVNDTPVGLQTLRDIAVQLVDIHSQHQNLLLADNDYQLQILDSLAGNHEILNEYKALYTDYRRKLKAYQVAKIRIEVGKADEEFLRFQLAQLEKVNLKPGEQEKLERRRVALQNMAEVKQRLASALAALSFGEPSAVDQLRRASDAIDSLPEGTEIDPQIAMRLRSVLIETRDLAETIEAADESIESDAGNLDEIDQRLNEIYSLERKHAVDNLEDLLAVRDRLSRRLEAINNGDETLRQLKAEARDAKKAAIEVATHLTERRARQADCFAKELRERALPLGMANLRCEIRLEPVNISSTGADKAEFLFSFNKNQEPMPAAKTASGGEISRLMLTIKAIAAEKMNMPAIIFDEVDTGVSGDIASRMGEMMRSISQRSQVITITHLPQVASKGRSHFKVYKTDDEQSTTTNIMHLSPQQRIEELALMLSGNATDPTAQAAARNLLNQN